MESEKPNHCLPLNRPKGRDLTAHARISATLKSVAGLRSMICSSVMFMMPCKFVSYYLYLLKVSVNVHYTCRASPRTCFRFYEPFFYFRCIEYLFSFSFSFFTCTLYNLINFSNHLLCFFHFTISALCSLMIS